MATKGIFGLHMLCVRQFRLGQNVGLQHITQLETIEKYRLREVIVPFLIMFLLGHTFIQNGHLSRYDGCVRLCGKRVFCYISLVGSALDTCLVAYLDSVVLIDGVAYDECVVNYLRLILVKRISLLRAQR